MGAYARGASPMRLIKPGDIRRAVPPLLDVVPDGDVPGSQHQRQCRDHLS